MNLINKVISDPAKAISYLEYDIFKRFGQQNFNKFIVLSRSRTGSNLLLSFINNHHNLHAKGEIFGSLRGQNYQDVLNKVFYKQPYFIKSAGFKIFYYHPEDVENCNIWNDLINMQNLFVIHLKRRNILRTLISKRIADTQNVWTISGAEDQNNIKPNTVSLTAKELKDGFEQTRKWEINGDKMFSDHPVLNIYYEDLVINPDKYFKEVTDFLNVPFIKPYTTLKKQNPGKVCDLVENFEELKAAFQKTKWQSFFNC